MFKNNIVPFIIHDNFKMSVIKN